MRYTFDSKLDWYYEYILHYVPKLLIYVNLNYLSSQLITSLRPVL